MEEFLLTNGSYAAIFLLLVLTGVGLPVPEEMVIVAAGILSSPTVQRLEPRLAVAVCLVGILLGDCTVFWIGRHFGNGPLRNRQWLAWAHRFERSEKLEFFIGKHGLKIFLLARFLVGVRAPLYLALGMVRLDFRRFLLYDTICGAVVVGIFFLASYHGGSWISDVIRNSQAKATIIALIVLAVGAGYYVISKICRSQMRLDETAPGETRLNDSETP